MALRIELEAENPGFAKFSARRWRGSEQVDLSVQRNQDNYYLQAQNNWGPEIYWHPITGLQVADEQLSGVVGAWLVDPLLSQVGNVRFLVQIKDSLSADYHDGGALKIASDVLASSARGDPRRAFTDSDVPAIPIETPPVSEAELVSEPVEVVTKETLVEQEAPVLKLTPEPVLEAQIPYAAPKKSRTLWGLLLLGLLLLIGAALGYFFFYRADPSPTAVTSSPIEGDCSLVQAPSDGLQFIQTCLKSSPTPEVILQVINQAKQLKQCDIAQRLYANQSQQNAMLAVAYAKEYDVQFNTGNACFKPDRETAIYWYETALTREPDNQIAKTRLAELKKE